MVLSISKYFAKSALFILILNLSVFTSKNILAQSNIEIHTAQKVYIADSLQTSIECFAVKDGYIIFTGSLFDAKTSYPSAKVLSHSGVITPGFIDAHCHFLAYCRGRKEVALFGMVSKEKTVKAVKKFARKSKRDWVIGRGWDQNLWETKDFPVSGDLNGIKKPVCLSRVDGHAIWLNDVALKTLNENWDTLINGGEIVKTKDGKPSGVFIDNAADWIQSKIPPMDEKTLTETVSKGAKNCYAQGLTTLDEAGLNVNEINFLKKLQQSGMLKMRFYAMLSANPESLAAIASGNIEETEFMSIRSMKIYLDGALGSRGALLKSSYCDRHHHHGLQITPVSELTFYSSYLLSKNFQVCVHAIGDSANAIVADIFSKTIPANFDARWRIEHAQIMDPKDQKKIANKSILPSVQPTHATSDAPWALDRLCNDSHPPKGRNKYSRITGAYAYSDLLKQSGIIALGTDFPVEDISTMATFYSATQRKDIQGKLQQPFLPNQALTRNQALLGMTLWAAHANREDQVKGSITVGKFADFIVLSDDLLTVEVEKLKKIKVKKTYISGQRVF